MERYYYFLAKRPLLCTFLLGIPLAAIYGLLLYSLDAHIALVIAISLLMLLVTRVYVNSAPSIKLTNKALAAHNAGDPYPLLEVSERLLALKPNEVQRQMLTINYCVALRDLGEHERVYQALSALDIDKCAGTLAQTKLVYYHNMADICDILGKDGEADAYFTKEKQCAERLKGEKLRRRLYPLILDAEADHALRHGRYEEALAYAKQAHAYREITPRANIFYELFLARVYLKMGKAEEAKPLLFSIKNTGGKLYAVTEAEALLKECEQENSRQEDGDGNQN